MFEIVQATTSDYAVVRSLLLDLYSHMARTAPDVFVLPQESHFYFSEERFRSDIASNNETHFIAKLVGANSYIGFVSVGSRQSSKNPIFRQDSYANIDTIYVVPEHRQRGVGNALFDAALIWSKERNLAIIRTGAYVANEDGTRFWQRKEFSPYKFLMEKTLETKE